MSGLTEMELLEIQKFTQGAPAKYTGLLMDETAKGRANATMIASFLDARGQQYTVGNLDAAVISLQHSLSWAPGTEPTAQDTRSTRAPRDTNNGVPRYEGTQYTDRANGIESSWAKDVREGREAHVQRNKQRERDAQRYKESHQTVLSPNGRTNYAESNRLNEQARQRHLAEDARESGRPAPVATGFRIIPDGETNFKGPAEAPYTSAELSAYLARRKGRAGEPHGSLLR
jgi:hypothetical protein